MVEVRQSLPRPSRSGTNCALRDWRNRAIHAFVGCLCVGHIAGPLRSIAALGMVPHASWQVSTNIGTTALIDSLPNRRLTLIDRRYDADRFRDAL